MKLNTHDHTPRSKTSKLLIGLFILCGVLIFGIFASVSFACIYYAQNVFGGVLIIFSLIIFTSIMLLHLKDMAKAYVEIREHDIYVVDYYLGIKTEKHFSFSDITSAEIHSGYSHKVKGYRFSAAGIKYIVFNNGNQYLFKIIALPETEEIFKQYIQ